MAKTVVGLFDDFSDAQHVAQELMDHGFPREDISVVANQDAVGRERMVGEEQHGTHADDYAGTGAVSGTVLGGALGALVGAGLLAIPGIGPVLAAGPLAAAVGTASATIGAGALGAGIGAAAGGLVGGLIGFGVPEEQANYYAEGVRRGGTLVTVTTDDQRANDAYAIMKRYNVVNIEDRATDWRGSGWRGRFDADAPTGTVDTTSTTRDRMAHSDDITNRSGDQVLPVVEEELQVDKRRVEKGGVRVSTHVEETPVEEQVNLREERVTVERRPVDRPLTDADEAALRNQDATVEIHESIEEPVVRKRARVIEEIIIDKEATNHSATVSDTVRRTEVDVDQAGATSSSADTKGFDALEKDYRSHYERTYGSAGYTYDDYAPVYRYGHSLATNSRYRNSDWKKVEPEARRQWEERNPNTWDDFKDTIRYAWDRARGKR
jgi:uncharacterized protein (TIGR02271 family)